MKINRYHYDMLAARQNAGINNLHKTTDPEIDDNGACMDGFVGQVISLLCTNAAINPIQ